MLKLKDFKEVIKVISIDQLQRELIDIKNGCGNKINSDGYCYYISSRGNLRLCSRCTNRFKLIEAEIKSRLKVMKNVHNK